MKALAGALLVAIGVAANMLSDLLIRGRGLDGVNGITAYSWDLTSTGLVFVGLAIVVFAKDEGKR